MCHNFARTTQLQGILGHQKHKASGPGGAFRIETEETHQVGKLATGGGVPVV